jgi:hypothetical protein
MCSKSDALPHEDPDVVKARNARTCVTSPGYPGDVSAADRPAGTGLVAREMTVGGKPGREDLLVPLLAEPAQT